MLTFLWLLPFLALLYGLFRWQQRGASLSRMVLAGLLAGVAYGIEPVIDMMRTAVNVNGAMTAGVVTQKLLGHKPNTNTS